VWIDHIARVRRTFNVTPNGKVGTLRDRPVFVAVSSGGRYSGARARQPDFLTPYLKAILGMIGLHNLTFFSVEGTAFGADAVAATRASTDEALKEYFVSPSIAWCRRCQFAEPARRLTGENVSRTGGATVNPHQRRGA
jgi:FMN-dependent NADH-azoreductase